MRVGERIGFIGLGIMGRPMARNLLAAGYPLTVHSRSPGPVDDLVDAGAASAVDVVALAAASDVVITMLPDTPDVVDVGGQVVRSAAPGTLFIDMSSVDPSAARELAAEGLERGVAVLDAPVSGGEKGAVEATLSIMVGGDDESFARARPVFDALGSSVVHVGPSGAGQVCKACNQLVVAATIEAVAEALRLAEAAGVDAGKVREALAGGFAGSKILEVHGRRMLDRSFDPGFRVRLHRKDARIVLDLAAETGSAVPSFAVVTEQLQKLVDRDQGERDHSALYLALEEEGD
jgi:2-hydroxy-3-oxopropionate reductase